MVFAYNQQRLEGVSGVIDLRPATSNSRGKPTNANPVIEGRPGATLD